MTIDAEQRPPNEPTGRAVAEDERQGYGGKTEGSDLMAVSQQTRKSSPVRNTTIALIAVVVVGSLVLSGILPRLRSRKALAAETNELAAPTVLVIQPKRGAPSQEILLPGNIQAFVDAPIYARTNGYLRC